jgi:hypothetical protein
VRVDVAIALIVAVAISSIGYGQTREEKVRADRAKAEKAGFWIYDDLPKGIAEAKRTGKPLLVALRCVPCVECVKLDDEPVDDDPELRPAPENFVRVRLVSTNGLDLKKFQFDYDQSFAMFFMNDDLDIYGRYGVRSHHSEWNEDVSLKGLAAALTGARRSPTTRSHSSVDGGRRRPRTGRSDSRAASRFARQAPSENRFHRQGRADMHSLPSSRRGDPSSEVREARRVERQELISVPAPEIRRLDFRSDVESDSSKRRAGYAGRASRFQSGG